MCRKPVVVPPESGLFAIFVFPIIAFDVGQTPPRSPPITRRV